MRCCKFLLVFIFFVFFVIDLNAQITPNEIDSLGFKQGMWQEFIVPIVFVTEYVGIEIPEVTSKYYYFTKDRDRKYFPIIECIGNYKDGIKSGVWVEYYGNDTVKSQIEYIGGVPTGKCKIYWGNGVLKMEYTIGTDDSIPVSMYETNGEFITTKMALKSNMIRAIYEN
jgi:hypothetical protein